MRQSTRAGRYGSLAVSVTSDQEASSAPWTVSVLVPVLDEERHLPEALAAMLAQELAEGEAEFIFADGGSTDGTRRLLEMAASRDRRIRLVDNPRRTTACGLNVALAQARGEYTARMDAHVAYPPDYLLLGVRRLQAGGVAWVSGPQIPVARDGLSGAVALALTSFAGTGGAPHRTMGEGETEIASGFTGVWETAVLRRHGGWDEAWPVNQDGELGARMRRAGERIVCIPSMAAEYIPRSSLKALARQYFRYGQFKTKTALKYPEVVRPGHLMPPLLVLTVAAALCGPRRLRSVARAGTIAYALGLLASGAHARRRAPVRRSAMVPVLLAVMHVAWGAGVLVALIRTAVGRGIGPK